MAQRAISAPYIEINDVRYAVYGNSITVDLGLADIGVSAVSAGGGAVETLHSVDVTTCIGMVKFKIPNVQSTFDALPEWKANVGTNTVKFYEGDIEYAMLGASFSEGRDIELNASEGGIEVTFKGDPMAT